MSITWKPPTSAAPGATRAANRLKLPLTQTNNPALAYDSRADGQLVYLKDVNFDRNGQPVILFLTSKGFEPGPENGPRQWQTAALDRKGMGAPPFHDLGQQLRSRLALHRSRRHLAGDRPDRPGPQPYNPGGEMVMWTSTDEGQTWSKVKQLTRNSPATTLTPGARSTRIRISTPFGPTATAASRFRILPLLHQPTRRPRLAFARQNGGRLASPVIAGE